MTIKVTGYQVNIRFSIPTIYVNLYQGNRQVGRIDVDDPALFPLVAFAVQQLATNDHVSWNETAQVLHLGMEDTGED